MSSRYPYQENWRDYRFRKALPFLGFVGWVGFVIVGLFLTPFIESVKELSGFNLYLIAFVLFIVGTIAATLYSSLWRCPRCNMVFGAADGLDALTRKAWRAKRCRICDLPRFYGSTYTADYWGEEKDRGLEDQVREGKD